MSAQSYFPFFIYATSIVALLFGFRYLSSGTSQLSTEGSRNMGLTLMVGVFLMFWMGARPVHFIFGDTVNYAVSYTNVTTDFGDIDFKSEWLWTIILKSCKIMDLSVRGFFTVVDGIYIFSLIWALKIITPKNVFMAFLFVLSSFSFFTFGVNGLRNGLGTHLLLLAMAFFLSGKKYVSLLIVFLAYGLHHSIILPTASFIAAIYLIKKPQWAIFIWLSSIVLSFFMGGYFNVLFAGLGFDDRFNAYLSTTNTLENATNQFRWDFLLYSSMPVLMTWYISIKENLADNWFRVLAVTYCLSNAFWVLVIRASFSNRFAYLSWFLYPIIIAYPLIMIDIWKDQDNKTAQVLLGYVIITLAICLISHMI